MPLPACAMPITHDVTRRGQHGIALVAVLVLLVILGVLGIVVLETISMELLLSGHHRTAVQAFYAAEAGLAEMQVRLARQGKEGFISDPAAAPDPHWTAYLLATSDWVPEDDPSFSPQATNYIPTMQSLRNTQIQRNSFQSTLSYWVKVRHYTEYDAERAGHRPATPHYQDLDGSQRLHRPTHVGQVIYWGYPTRQTTQQVRFTTRMPTPYFPIEYVTAVGQMGSSMVRIHVELVHPPGPPQVAAVYARREVVLLGPPDSVSGKDACGVVASLPSLVVSPSGRIQRAPSLEGMSKQSQIVIDLDQAVVRLASGAMRLDSRYMNGMFGSPSQYGTYHRVSHGTRPALTLQNGLGYGILLVDGDVTLKGHIQWYGMIIATGTLVFRGEAPGIVVRGGIWADRVIDLNGHVTVSYDSCQIRQALLPRPLRIITWKEE
ncbi:MAG: hypothetical protein D6704_12700 [Nitrospirae bacterium]|nr:MAG: hypothetical protein D6704_12700 [Nitrospirota bacterium]